MNEDNRKKHTIDIQPSTYELASKAYPGSNRLDDIALRIDHGSYIRLTRTLNYETAEKEVEHWNSQRGDVSDKAIFRVWLATACTGEPAPAHEQVEIRLHWLSRHTSLDDLKQLVDLADRFEKNER